MYILPDLIKEEFSDDYSEQEIQRAKVFGTSFFRNITRFVIKSGPNEEEIIGKSRKTFKIRKSKTKKSSRLNL